MASVHRVTSHVHREKKICRSHKLSASKAKSISIMSSDEDYNPRVALEAQGSLKRIKRLAKFDSLNAGRTKVLRKNEKKFASKRLLEKKKIQKLRKPCRDEGPQTKEKSEDMTCQFNGEPLSNLELYQLYAKFTRDGHFRVNPSNSTHVQSRTIHSGNEKNHRKHDASATITSREKSIDSESNKQWNKHLYLNVTDPLTFSNPLPNATGSTMHISCNNDKTIMGNINNGLSGNLRSNGIEYRKKFLSSGHVQTMNNFESSSNTNSTPLMNSSKQTQFSWNTMRFNRMFTPENVQCNFDNSFIENRNDFVTRDTYCSIGNSDQLGCDLSGIQNYRFNNPLIGCENANIENFSSLPINHNHNYSNIISSENTTNLFDNRQSLDFNAPNGVKSYENSQENWVFAGQIVPTSFATENSLCENPISNMTENSMSYVASPHTIGYNPQIGNSTCKNGNQNSYDLLTSWNNSQTIPNLYVTESNEFQCNSANTLPKSSIIPIPTTIMNGTGNFVNRMNIWSETDSPHNEYTMSGNKENLFNSDKFSTMNMDSRYTVGNISHANDNSTTTACKTVDSKINL